MKIYILDAFHPSGVEFISRHAEVVRWDDSRIEDWPEDAEGLMVRVSPVRKAQIERAQKLRVISKQGVGLDNIDLVAAKARGIIVCNTPGVNSEAAAEMALALGLAVARRLAEFDRLIRSGVAIERPRYLGIEMLQKTVGVIGMGNIGTRAARKWHAAFDAKLLAYDPYVPSETWCDIPHERVPSLDILLPRVDLLTLHVPLTPETRHMIGRRELALMKETAILVNVSRGGIVDEQALYAALESGRLFGAGVDVFEKEPVTKDDPLMSLPNVIGTPHAGGGTRETQQKSSLMVAQQLLNVLSGEEPFNRVV